MYHITNRMRNDLELTKSLIEFAIWIQRNPFDEEILLELLQQVEDQKELVNRLERKFNSNLG